MDTLRNEILCGDEDACVLTGLLFEQARGQEVSPLLAELGAANRIGAPLLAAEREALVSALHQLLRAEAPPVAVVFALRASADPADMRPLVSRLRQELATRPEGLLAEQILGAVLSIEWPEAEECARLASRLGEGQVREEAVAWLQMFR